MTYYIGSMPFGGDDIQHHGIKGMKWGIRRYRNEDGTLTDAGKKRYSQNDRLLYKSYVRDAKKLNKLKKDADNTYQSKRAAEKREKAKQNLKRSAVDAVAAATARMVANAAHNRGGGLVVRSRDWGTKKTLSSLANPMAHYTLQASNAALAISAASAAIRLGTAAVQGVQAANAYRKSTDAGHARATIKYQRHVERMIRTYGDTEYGKLIEH